MKILSWASWYPSERQPGHGIFIKKHIDVIAQQHEVRVFFCHWDKGLFGFERKVTVVKNKTEVAYEVPSFLPLKWLCFFVIPMVEALVFVLKKGKIDVFHMHAAYPLAIATVGLELFFIPRWVLTEHWYGYNDGVGIYNNMNALARGLLAQRIRRMDAVSAVSESLQKDMQRHNLLSERFVLTPNVVEIPIVISTKKTGTSFSFFTLSNLLDNQKNLSGIIRAFCQALLKNKNLQLHIYGSGSDEVMLKNLAGSFLEKNIFFAGFVPNYALPSVYAKHDAFVLFSNYETFSIATAEALAHGLPAIVSRCGGPEDFVNANNGILVAPQNEAALTEAMLYLAQNFEQYKAQKISASVASFFNIEQITAAFNKLYRYG